MEAVLVLVSGAWWCGGVATVWWCGSVATVWCGVACGCGRCGESAGEWREGGDAALSTSSSLSLWVWRIMWAALTSRLLSCLPSAGSAGGGGGGCGLCAAVAGQNRR